jgi:hypothetical protein
MCDAIIVALLLVLLVVACMHVFMPMHTHTASGSSSGTTKPPAINVTVTPGSPSVAVAHPTGPSGEPVAAPVVVSAHSAPVAAQAAVKECMMSMPDWMQVWWWGNKWQELRARLM